MGIATPSAARRRRLLLPAAALGVSGLLLTACGARPTGVAMPMGSSFRKARCEARGRWPRKDGARAGGPVRMSASLPNGGPVPSGGGGRWGQWWSSPVSTCSAAAVKTRMPTPMARSSGA